MTSGLVMVFERDSYGRGGLKKCYVAYYGEDRIPSRVPS